MARLIIDVTGWAFLVVGLAFTIIAAMGPSAPGVIPPLYNALGNLLFFVAPAGFLITRRTRTPAVVMMISSALTALALFAVTVRLGGDVSPRLLGVARLTISVWLVMFGLSWRSFLAASALRRLKSVSADAV